MPIKGLPVLAILVVGVSLASQTLADTYVSKWINGSTCQYVITRNSPDPVLLAAGQTKDFGPFPYQISGENSIVIGRVEFRNQTCIGPTAFDIDFSQGYEKADCPGSDTGPYKLTVLYADDQETDLCYCLRFGQVGYIVTRITDRDTVTEDEDDDPVMLEATAGAYSC